MKLPALQRAGLAMASALLLALSACAGDSRTETAPAARTTPTEPRLLAEEYAEGEAVVQAVNPVDRLLTLRNERGQSNTIKVPADVDLNRLKKGDTVLFGIYQSLSIRVLPPGSTPLGASAAVGSTAPGQPEGRAWGQQLVVINEITGIDLAAHTVTLRGADGQPRTIAVKDPQMQERMRNLQVGDLVELTYSESVAAKVLPKS
ncbi:MAG TPA: hypothetical protein VES39_06905 [Rhodospirillales bacterium]|nr:hypothetical protein [Rhodospirillales bacterium]